MHTPLLRRFLVGGAATGAVALSGCAATTTHGPPVGGQGSPLAAVSVSQRFCANNGPIFTPVPTDGPCPSFVSFTTTDSNGTTTRAFTEDGTARLLVAVAAPDASPEPSLSLAEHPEAKFSRDDSFATTDRLGAAPDGTHWAGFRSSVVGFVLGQENAGGTVIARIAAPRTEGRPTGEAVPVRIGVGTQVVQDGSGNRYDPDRAVDCADTAAGPGSEADATSCPGSEAADDVATTDAVVEAPAAATVTAGKTATLPFAVRLGGTSDDASLELSATTTLDGATVELSPSSLAFPTPAPPVDVPPTTTTTTTLDRPATVARADAEDGSTEVPVSVDVPAATPAGDYTVTLRASDGTLDRTATARLQVTAPVVATTPPATTTTPVPVPVPAPAPAPTAVPAAKPQILRAAKVSVRTRRVHLGRVTCAAGGRTCAVRVVLRIENRVVGVRKLRLAAGRSKGLSFVLSAAQVERLARTTGRATVTITTPGTKPVIRTTQLTATTR